MISDHITIYNRAGASETLPADQARYQAYTSRGEWSLEPPPPPNWDRELPRWRATRSLKPSPNSRHRLEPPFTTIFSSDIWQFSEREIAAGDEFVSQSWPHPSLRPLNYSAEKVLSFFNSAMKSRLPRSPWHEGRVRLDNGLTGPTEIDIASRSGLTPPAPRHPGPSTGRPAA
jgi:hypothetical protein